MTAGSFFFGRWRLFHAFEWVPQQNTHTQIFHSSKQKNVEEREEKRPRPKKGSGVLFLGRRGKPLVKKKEKRNGETKKKCMSLSRVSPKKKKRTSNKHFKKNRVKVARAPSSSSIRITRGNRRGFVLNEEEGEGEEERDGRESFWWGRGRSRANRK